MALTEYRKKRDFSRTSEPRTSRLKPPAAGLAYVIQRHRATHLHYDLRLEEDGVLKSWAVPKIPVNKPGIKRLAVQTEDHPLGYERFEGTIPKGEYGGGDVDIWDTGVYRPELVERDKKIVEIKGRKLKGRFALIRIKARDGADNAWLFFKLKETP